MRRYARQDSNHKEVRAAFERLGCSVCDTSTIGKGTPDIVVGYGGLCICVEIKDGAKPPSARKLTPDEEKFRMNWKGGYRLVENLDHVLETVNVLKGWQASILAFHRTVLVAPPVTKGKAELQEEFNQALKDSQPAILEKMGPYMNDHDRLKLKLNQVVDDYDLTSNDTRRGD